MWWLSFVEAGKSDLFLGICNFFIVFLISNFKDKVKINYIGNAYKDSMNKLNCASELKLLQSSFSELGLCSCLMIVSRINKAYDQICSL